MSPSQYAKCGGNISPVTLEEDEDETDDANE